VRPPWRALTTRCRTAWLSSSTRCCRDRAARNVFVERSSQKAIIIGKGGARLREVGTTARKGIEALLGQRIYLDLHVKVAKDWQRDPKQLQRLGF
jgi:GTPase Era involved in 16S rRNA processing